MHGSARDLLFWQEVDRRNPIGAQCVGRLRRPVDEIRDNLRSARSKLPDIVPHKRKLHEARTAADLLRDMAAEGRPRHDGPAAGPTGRQGRSRAAGSQRKPRLGGSQLPRRALHQWPTGRACAAQIGYRAPRCSSWTFSPRPALGCSICRQQLLRRAPFAICRVVGRKEEKCHRKSTRRSSKQRTR